MLSIVFIKSDISRLYLCEVLLPLEYLNETKLYFRISGISSVGSAVIRLPKEIPPVPLTEIRMRISDAGT